MRAAIATAVDAPLSISERNVPEPGPGEVLVKISACGVCFSDLNLVRGHYRSADHSTIASDSPIAGRNSQSDPNRDPVPGRRFCPAFTGLRHLPGSPGLLVGSTSVFPVSEALPATARLAPGYCDLQLAGTA